MMATRRLSVYSIGSNSFRPGAYNWSSFISKSTGSSFAASLKSAVARRGGGEDRGDGGGGGGGGGRVLLNSFTRGSVDLLLACFGFHFSLRLVRQHGRSFTLAGKFIEERIDTPNKAIDVGTEVTPTLDGRCVEKAEIVQAGR